MSSVIPEQIKHFNDFANEWWHKDGLFKGLHHMTPARMAFITQSAGDLTGKTVLDVGCGGGLMSEAMVKAGAQVTGLDAGVDAIEAAKAHAAQSGLDITYLNQAVEEHTSLYDVVTALDIIEHVENPAAFIKSCAQRLKPGGKLVVSTLNRTWKSYVFGIVVAENLAGLAPKGSHTWQKFVEPAELARFCRAAGLSVSAPMGMVFNVVEQSFSLSAQKLGINYILCASLLG